MTDVRGEQKQGLSEGLLLGGLIVVAFVLRFARLGLWSLDSDEVFMRRDSLNFRFTNPRPLLYFINHYVIAPIIPLDEFGIRLLPATFGVLAIPVLYLVTRRLFGARAALFAAALLAVSPVHVSYSQFGRYWSLVFLLATIYPYALYLGVRERNGRALALGIATALLATLAHPSAVLLMGGPAALLAFHYLRPDRLKVLWALPAFRWAALAAVVVAVAILIRFIPILHGWIYEHDANPGPGQFLLRKPPRPLKPVLYVLAYVEAWTIPLILAGAAGIYSALAGSRPDARALPGESVSLSAGVPLSCHVPHAGLHLLSAGGGAGVLHGGRLLPRPHLADGVESAAALAGARADRGPDADTRNAHAGVAAAERPPLRFQGGGGVARSRDSRPATSCTPTSRWR